jgi:hypothetical protein
VWRFLTVDGRMLGMANHWVRTAAAALAVWAILILVAVAFGEVDWVGLLVIGSAATVGLVVGEVRRERSRRAN